MAPRLFLNDAGVIQKAQPTPGDAHVNTPLTNLSVAYVQDQEMFIADDVFPIVPVQQMSNVYYIFSKEDFLRDEARPRAPGAESAGGGFGLTTAAYGAIVEAFHKDIDDQLRANADTVLSLDSAATRFVTQKLLIRRERKWMSGYFTTGIWTTDVVGVVSAPAGGQFIQWDQAASDPVADVETGKLAILGVTGELANTLTIGATVLSRLRNNTRVRDQFKYTSAESIDVEMLANLFGVDQILVSNAIYVSTREGAATQTTTFIAGKNALLTYTNPLPNLMSVSAGYTFAWVGYIGAGEGGIRISRFRADLLRSDRIEGEIAYDMKKVSADCGYFYSGAVA